MGSAAGRVKDAATSSVDYYRARCAGPPAMLSLGPYPGGTDGLVDGADSALAGSVVVLNQLPAACAATGSTDVGDTFLIDQVVWGASLKQASVGLSFVDGSAVHYYALHQRLLYLGPYPNYEGPTSTGWCGVLGSAVLDLGRYRQAAADMIKLRPFVADRKIYEELTAAQVVADAVVTSAGPQQSLDPNGGSYQVALTLQIRRTLCGDATKGLVVRYLGNEDEGGFNAAGVIPPFVGEELIVFLGPSTLGPPARYDLLRIAESDATSTLDAQWSRFAALLSSPPSLSL